MVNAGYYNTRQSYNMLRRVGPFYQFILNPSNQPMRRQHGGMPGCRAACGAAGRNEVEPKRGDAGGGVRRRCGGRQAAGSSAECRGRRRNGRNGEKRQRNRRYNSVVSQAAAVTRSRYEKTETGTQVWRHVTCRAHVTLRSSEAGGRPA